MTNMTNINDSVKIDDTEIIKTPSTFTLKDIKNKIVESNELQNVSLNLGENKIIQIKKWTGKQILDYGDSIDNIEEQYLSRTNIDPINVVDAIPKLIEKHLIKESVIDSDKFYFNDLEKLYVLFNLRKLSLNKPLNIHNVCSKCSHQEIVQVNLSDIQEKITPNRNGVLSLSNGIQFQINQIKNPQAMESKTNEKKLLSEICLRINQVSYGSETVNIIIFDELMDIVTSLSNEDFNELITTYLKDFAFDYSLEKIKHTCSNPDCGHVNLLDCEDIMLIIEGI